MTSSQLVTERSSPQDDLLLTLLAPETYTRPRLSPDARRIAYVHSEDGQEHLRVRTTSPGTDEHVTTLPRGSVVRALRWTSGGAYLIVECGRRGVSTSILLVLDGETLEAVTFDQPLLAREFWVADDRPELLLATPVTGAGGQPALLRVGLPGATAEPLDVPDAARTHRWLVDRDLRVRGRTTFAEDGTLAVDLGDAFPGDGRTVCTIGREWVPDFSFEGFDRTGRYAYLLSSTDAPTRRLLAVESASGRLETVYEHPMLDVDGYPIGGGGVWFDPVTGEPDICSVIDQRIRYIPLRTSVSGKIARLEADPDNPLLLIDRSRDDRSWVTVEIHTDGPISYRLEQPSEPPRLLFHNRPGLLGRRLARLEDFTFRASDGLPLGGYAMRPAGARGPCPAVVLVHGGPAARDYWRFHADAQYFAALGLVSLHVNYRGSRGYGQAFRAAGYGQWGRRMQEDLYDAVTEAVRREIVDPACVVLYGSSYGGYAALVGACTRPDIVRCAVAVSPPCDLLRFASAPPAYWRPLAPLLQYQLLGPGRALDGDAAWLVDRSPQHLLDEHCAPLLIAHGAQDPRVPVEEVDAFVERARSLSVDVRYERFESEAHEIRSPVNRIQLFDAVEELLSDLTEVRRG